MYVFSNLVIALICIPIMLIPKPFIVYFSQKKPEKKDYNEFLDEVIDE
jgi:hypothetical protein